MPGATRGPEKSSGKRDIAVEALWHQPVHASRVTALVLSADGTQLFTGCDAAVPKPEVAASPEAAVRQLDCQDGKVLRSYQSEAPVNVRLLALQKKGGCELLACDGDRGLTRWHTPDGAHIGSRTALQASSISAALPAPLREEAGAEAAQAAECAGTECGTPDEETGEGLHRVEQGDTQGVEADALPAAARGSVREEPASDAPTAQAGGGSFLQRLIGAPSSMHATVLSQDGSVLYAGSRGASERDITVWSVGSGRLLRTLTGHSGPVLCLCLCPDGASLYSGSYDKTIRVWSTKDGRLVRTVKAHRSGVRALAVAPGGGRLYSCGSDNTIQVWDTARWLCLRALHGRHEDATWPMCMALSADGKLLASGSNGLFGGSTIKVFDTEGAHDTDAGKCLATFAQLGFQEKGDVSSLLFSPDGQRIYSGASDGTVAAWKLTLISPHAGQAGMRTGFL